MEGQRSPEEQAQEDARAKKIFKEALKEAMSEDNETREKKKERILKEPNKIKRQKMIRDNMDLFKN